MYYIFIYIYIYIYIHIMGMRSPTLRVEIALESNPPKSRILVRRMNT